MQQESDCQCLKWLKRVQIAGEIIRFTQELSGDIQYKPMLMVSCKPVKKMKNQLKRIFGSTGAQGVVVRHLGDE